MAGATKTYYQANPCFSVQFHLGPRLRDTKFLFEVLIQDILGRATTALQPLSSCWEGTNEENEEKTPEAQVQMVLIIGSVGLSRSVE
jgi:hypothetical protein